MAEEADRVFYNGIIYTVDPQHSVQEAVAIREGYIQALGSDREILDYYVGAKTQVTDLQGRMMLPGLIDCHLHPFWGGEQLCSCSLDYASLTVPEILTRIQGYLDQDIGKGVNDWLEVRAWQRRLMQPAGTEITRFDLDSLNTERPVVLFSNNCHTLVANSRALALLGLNESVSNPSDGVICRTEEGVLNGILEDAPAMRAHDYISEQMSQSMSEQIAETLQRALHRQGVTTVMDARVLPRSLDAFMMLRQKGRQTLRYLGAREVTPEQATDRDTVAEAVREAAQFAEHYNQCSWEPGAGVSVHSIKLFLDGILNAKAKSAALLQPYFVNRGTAAEPDWQLSDEYGNLYFSQEILNEIMCASARAGLDVHIHTIADGAIEVSLNAVEKMRQQFPDVDVRPVFAHNELLAAPQFQRFKALNVTAVLSLQWSALTQKQAEETCRLLGADRFRYFEPAGRFVDAGVRMAYGSDWPIEPLNEWYHFQIGLTRREAQAMPRLDNDRDLTIAEVIRAATIEAAYVVHQEQTIGSLESGKFADLIIVDRNLLESGVEEIGKTQVLLTMVGGQVVFDAVQEEG